MFIIRSLWDKVGAPSTAKAELANLDGCFYLVRPTVTVKGAKECLFQTAIASIRRTSQPFQFELVVNTAVTEEEAQLLDEDAESLDEYVSLIDSRMRLTVQPASEADSDKPGAMALTWLDLAGEEEDAFLFVVEGATEEAIAQFELTMYRCMWERDNNRDSRDVKPDDLLPYRIPVAGPRKSAALADTPLAPSSPIPSSAEPTPSRKGKQPLFRAPSPSSSDDDVANELTAAIANLKVANAASATPNAHDHPFSSTTPSKADRRVSTGSTRSPYSAPEAAGYPDVAELAKQEEQELDVAVQQLEAASAPVEQAEAPGTAEDEPQPEEEAPTGPTLDDITRATLDPPDNRQLVFSEKCDINIYDQATGMFMQQEAGVAASLWLVKNAQYSCWLSVAGNNGFTWLSTPVDSSLPLHFEEQHLSVIISFSNKRTKQNFTWLLRCPEPEVYHRMNDAFVKGVFESTNGIGAWSKLKPDEQRYNADMYRDDVEMVDAEPYEASDDEEDQEALADERRQQEGREFGEEELYPEEEGDEEEDESEDDESEEQVSGRKQTKNSLLAVGYKGMSFVVRGDMIGVFENQKGTGKKLKFMTNIAGIARPGSQSTFVPNKVMLHDQDTTMILSDPLNSKSLYRLDLTTGKVVDEWKVSDNLNVNNFIPDSKYAQTTQQQTFIGTSHNGIFRIDPRLSGSKLVDSEYKQYASKNDFSAAATTDSGRLAVASNKGEIRLFDAIGKNAKTALPAMGAPIIGVDVSADGRYVIATTQTYLLFIDTKIREGRYTGQSGFDRSFPADAKPKPIRLELKAEHLDYIGGSLSFTPAKFNMGVGELEKTIVTSTGPFVVAFNFRSVKAGKCGKNSEYKIKRYDDTVVADNFRFGDDREIVVTMPNDLRMEAKSQLQAPSRKSLAPSYTPRASTSGIRRTNIIKQWEEE